MTKHTFNTIASRSRRTQTTISQDDEQLSATPQVGLLPSAVVPRDSQQLSATSQSRQSQMRFLTFLIAFLLACALIPLSACSTGTEPAPSSGDATTVQKLAIIHTNDTHGYDMATEPTDSAPGSLGMAAVPSLVKDYKAEGYEVLLFDDGDAIQATNLVNLSQGETAIEFMNQAGYQAMALGNHEFDWGVDNLNKLRDEAHFPFLSANVIVEATNQTYTQPNAIFTLDNGAKVGVFGLTTPESSTKSSPKNTAGLNFLAGEDLYACAQFQIDELKAQGCTMIICLGHLGSSEENAPNRSTDVLEHTHGIDLFIDGHDHRVVDETVNSSLLVSTGSHLENIGVVTYEDSNYTNEMITYGSYDGKDEATDALINKRNDEVSAELDKIIGSSTVALDGERAPGVRTQETNLGDFAADATLWQAQQVGDSVVDGAIVNGGSIRASIPAGDISMSLLKTVFPYNNSLNVVTLTGAELLETLEAATFSLPEAAGSFPQVAGISYTIDTSVPYEQGEAYPNSTYYAPANPGARVTITDVGGKGFALDATYAIAASSFITDGGDTYYVMAKAYIANGYITGINDSDTLTNYLSSELGGVIGEKYAAVQGRITIH